MNLRNRTIYIGDNLRRLRGIDSDSVDLIYLDPPFNSRGEYQWPIGTDEVEWDDEPAGDDTDDLDDEALERLIGGNGFDKFKDAFSLDDLDERVLQELLDNGEPAGYVIAAAGAAVGPGSQAYLTYMWERLIEMRRILKRSGSIYLHCDDTEGAWLQALMDAIFGRGNFRNEITWQRKRARTMMPAGLGEYLTNCCSTRCRPTPSSTETGSLDHLIAAMWTRSTHAVEMIHEVGGDEAISLRMASGRERAGKCGETTTRRVLGGIGRCLGPLDEAGTPTGSLRTSSPVMKRSRVYMHV